MNIAIAGAPKSATTGLFYKVKNSLDGSVRELFEKQEFTPDAAAGHDHVVAKFLIRTSLQPIGGWDLFDRKIGIIRDPRDWIISGLLYGIFVSTYLKNDKSAAARFVALLKKKERDPRSVSVLQIIDCSNHDAGNDLAAYREDLRAQNTEWMNSIMTFFTRHPECHVLKYEDFVDENFADLEAYLGFPLKGSGQVDERHLRVVRTKKAGDWKNWFLEDDVTFFRPIFKEFMERFGYADDWTLPPDPVIAVEASSNYVRSLVAEREAQTRINEELFSETSAMSQSLLKSVREEIIPALVDRTDLDGKVDDLLLLLHYIVKYSAYQAEIVQKRESKLLNMEAKLEKALLKVEALREEKRQLTRSWPWKVTKPLRKLNQLFVPGKESPAASPVAER